MNQPNVNTTFRKNFQRGAVRLPRPKVRGGHSWVWYGVFGRGQPNRYSSLSYTVYTCIRLGSHTLGSDVRGWYRGIYPVYLPLPTIPVMSHYEPVLQSIARSAPCVRPQ